MQSSLVLESRHLVCGVAEEPLAVLTERVEGGLKQVLVFKSEVADLPRWVLSALLFIIRINSTSQVVLEGENVGGDRVPNQGLPQLFEQSGHSGRWGCH